MRREPALPGERPHSWRLSLPNNAAWPLHVALGFFLLGVFCKACTLVPI